MRTVLTSIANLRAYLRRDGRAANGIALYQHRQAMQVATRFVNETQRLEARDTYGKAFLQVTNLWTKDEAVKRFVFEKKFAQLAAALLGVEKVRLYHNQALFKEAGGGRTPWH